MTTEQCINRKVYRILELLKSGAAAGLLKKAEVVDELPEPSKDTMRILYLVPSTTPGQEGTRDEYITVETDGIYTWEKLGVNVDLSEYAELDDLVFEKGSGENSIQQKDTGADASGEGAIAFGNSEASKKYSFAEGYKTKAQGDDSHSEGVTSKATGTGAHAEGNNTTAYGNYSHSEGDTTRALGTCSHTEGTGSAAGGSDAHAEGRYSNAQGTYSHAEGVYTQAVNQAEHAQGKYNKSNSGNTAALKTQHSVGIGTSNADRKNAFEIMQNGDIYVVGLGGYDGTNANAATTLQDLIGDIETLLAAI